MKNSYNDIDLKILIPLRGGSQGIPNKNIRLFNGRPLFTCTGQAAIDTGFPLVISTDSEEIKAMAQRYLPESMILDRPANLATSTASTEAVISHFLDQVGFDHCLLMQATSPLSTANHIIDAIKQYINNDYRPLVTGTRKHEFYWNHCGLPINYDPLNRPRRQDWDGTFVENGAFYIFSRESFERSGSRCPAPCTLFEMDSIHGYEIDTELDWTILEKLSQEKENP